MTPLRLSHTWHRRFYVATFLLSLSLVGIYVIGTATDITIPVSLKVTFVSAVIAGLSALLSAIFFIIEKKLSGFGYSFAVYLLLTAALAWQIVQTGGTWSLFVIPWTLIPFFAALFGAYGWVTLLALTGTYIAGAYLGKDLGFETAGIVALSSLIPLITGIIVWREQGEIDDSTRNVKNLANQLSEVASKSEIVINAIGDGVIAIDPTGTIELINPAAQQMLGWGKQDALKLSYKSILKLENEIGKELDPTVEPIQQVLNTNQQARAKHLIATTKSGKKISVSLVANPIGSTGSGAIIVFRDITNDRAEEREQAEFISTASHEMRTPVASIEGYLGLAMNPNTATVDARAKDYIVKAHEAAQHLGRLFQDLLDVSKTEDGRLTNVPKVIDVAALTETIVEGLTEKATKKGLRLLFNSEDGSTVNKSQKKIMPVYYVNQDNDHIREILDNLIDNAIKYTPSGEVSVDITGQEDKVVISVKDSGLGIPAEDIPHLFQKFYRVNNTDRQEIGGTGLGLYLVRRLTENMQGRIWVESVFQQGSTFFLELPRIDTQEAERLKEDQQRRAQQAAQMVPIAAAPAPVPASNAAPIPVAPVAAVQAQIAPQPISTAPFTAPAPNVTPVPVAMPVVAPTPVQATQPTQPVPAARPATSVPRGETLTREQINERVKQLEALAQQQRGNTGR